MAIKNIWSSSGSVKLIPSNEKFLTSHCACVDLHSLHSDPLLICGTYMPFDRAHRNNIYAPLKKKCRPTNTQCLLETGMLPSTRPTDPSRRTPNSSTTIPHGPGQHAWRVPKADRPTDIDPVNECLRECRTRIFRSNRADANGSRIDDVLTSTALRDSANYLQFPDCNGDSDHKPIVAAINTQSLTLISPPPALPDQPKPPRFKTPMKVKELAKFREVLG